MNAPHRRQPPRTRRPGRPALPQDQRRTHHISVAFNDAELLALEAARGHFMRGTWLRHAAFLNAPPRVPEVNREAWLKLSRLAGNLNQAMIKVHSGELKNLDGVDFKTLLHAVNEVRDLLIGERHRAEENDEA